MRLHAFTGHRANISNEFVCKLNTAYLFPFNDSIQKGLAHNVALIRQITK